MVNILIGETMITFECEDLLARLENMDDAALDDLDFGVIGFTGDTVVCRYNSFEAGAAALSADKAKGRLLFTELAQCMNNFMVAQRFEDAAEVQTLLDKTLDYTLTWKMNPTRVTLRLLYSPLFHTRYVLIRRLS